MRWQFIMTTRRSTCFGVMRRSAAMDCSIYPIWPVNARRLAIPTPAPVIWGSHSRPPTPTWIRRDGTCLCLGALRDTLGITSDALYVVGGGAQSALWMQILGRCDKLPVRVVRRQQCSSQRAWLLVGEQQTGVASETAARQSIPVAAEI